MIVEFLLTAVANTGFAIIAFIEYSAQAPSDASAKQRDRSNRCAFILLGLCVLIGNVVIWIPALCGL